MQGHCRNHFKTEVRRISGGNTPKKCFDNKFIQDLKFFRYHNSFQIPSFSVQFFFGLKISWSIQDYSYPQYFCPIVFTPNFCSESKHIDIYFIQNIRWPKSYFLSGFFYYTLFSTKISPKLFGIVHFKIKFSLTKIS